MRLKISELRRIIRQVLLENPTGPGVTADPTNPDGFYPYEVQRGTDIYGYWYKSPGDKGSNPMRPDDPAEYIGLKTKGASPEEPAAASAPKQQG